MIDPNVFMVIQNVNVSSILCYSGSVCFSITLVIFTFKYYRPRFSRVAIIASHAFVSTFPKSQTGN